MSRDEVLTSALNALVLKLEKAVVLAPLKGMREQRLRQLAQGYKSAQFCCCDVAEAVSSRQLRLQTLVEIRDPGQERRFRMLPFWHLVWRPVNQAVPYLEVIELPHVGVGFSDKCLYFKNLGEFDEYSSNGYTTIVLPGLPGDRSAHSVEDLWGLRAKLMKECYEVTGKVGHIYLSLPALATEHSVFEANSRYDDACFLSSGSSPWEFHQRRAVPLVVDGWRTVCDLLTFALSEAHLRPGQIG